MKKQIVLVYVLAHCVLSSLTSAAEESLYGEISEAPVEQSQAPVDKTATLSSTASQTPIKQASHWWVELEAGVALPVAQSKTTTVTMWLAPPDNDYYTSKPASSPVLSGGIGGGYQFNFSFFDRWLPHYRLGVFYNNIIASSVTGTISQHLANRPPAFNYTYQIQSQVFWLDNQFDLISYKAVTPFLDLALGAAFNQVSNYSEAATSQLPARVGPAFPVTTTTSLAWRLGLGVNYRLPWLHEAMNVGLMLRYSNLGTASTGISATVPSFGGAELKMPVQNAEVALTFRYDI